MIPSLHKIKVSPCETYHVLLNSPLYQYRFQKVLKFHPPGFAPAKDATGAFHITLEGKPAYKERFKQTFGFYCFHAGIETDAGWCHIQTDGRPIYKDRYDWVGNYQENICAVRDLQGNYFHINLQGKRIYPHNYCYVGDFKDGIAVVCHANGKSSHIDEQGKFIHNQWYKQLDIFHKDFARVKDEKGWFHITKEGIPAYSHRFMTIEPFYNGQAHAQMHTGTLVIINETGNVIREIYPVQRNFVGELSSDYVGFWKSETIQLAIELGLLDVLPAKIDEIVRKCHILIPKVKRVLRALDEIGVVEKPDEEWVLTDKGHYLASSNKSFMAAASQMWSKVQNEWRYLIEKLKEEGDYHHPTFKERTIDEKELEIYRRAIEGYALHDFEEVAKRPCWSDYSSLVSFGQTGTILLREILKKNSLISGILASENKPLYHFTIEPDLQNRLTHVFIEYDKEWFISAAEAVLMPRFLHYFPDKDVINLLEKTNKTLSKNGHIYIFELVLDPHSSTGGLLDLNMLAESGGRLRTFEEWKTILSKTGFSVSKIESIKPHLHLIQGCKK